LFFVEFKSLETGKNENSGISLALVIYSCQASDPLRHCGFEGDAGLFTLFP